jgi:hypothetical protein
MEVGVLGEGVYKFLRPDTLRAMHFYMGVGGSDRFLTTIPIDQWNDADRLAAAHLQQFCKCEGSGCIACRLKDSVRDLKTS